MEAVRLRRRKGRVETGLALLEGPTLLEEAHRAGVAIRTVIAVPTDTTSIEVAEAAGARVVLATEGALVKASSTKAPQSPVATFEIPASEIAASGDLLVAWGVSDPGNAGTLIRSCAAFGLGYVAGPNTVDSWSPKVVRAAAGAHFRTSLGQVETIAELRAHRVRIVATVARGGRAPGPQEADTAFLVGSESHGLDDAVVAGVDDLITIPMGESTESLNAGVAGSIVAFATRPPSGDSG